MDAHNKLAEEQQKKQEIKACINSLRADKQSLIERLEEVEKKRENGTISLSEYDAFLESTFRGANQKEAIDAYDELILKHQNNLKQTDSGIELLQEMTKYHDVIPTSQIEEKSGINKTMIAFIVLLLVVGVSMFAFTQMEGGATGMVIKDTQSNSVEKIPSPPISPPNPDLTQTSNFMPFS